MSSIVLSFFFLTFRFFVGVLFLEENERWDDWPRSAGTAAFIAHPHGHTHCRWRKERERVVVHPHSQVATEGQLVSAGTTTNKPRRPPWLSNGGAALSTWAGIPGDLRSHSGRRHQWRMRRQRTPGRDGIVVAAARDRSAVCFALLGLRTTRSDPNLLIIPFLPCTRFCFFVIVQSSSQFVIRYLPPQST
jgi:hypothetical protein